MFYIILSCLGAAFCYSVYERVQSVVRSTVALVQQDIPHQTEIAGLKAHIVEQEPILYEYYATENASTFAGRFKRNQDSIDLGLATLTQRYPADTRVADIRHRRSEVVSSAAELDRNLASQETDWDAARSTLARISDASSEIKQHLDSLLVDLHTGVTTRAGSVHRLVNEIVAITVLSSIGMFALAVLAGRYILRSLADTWKQRRLAYFPERNPALVMSYSLSGELQYANPSCRAAAQTRRDDGDPQRALLPDDLQEHLAQLRGSTDASRTFEYSKNGQVFCCVMHHLPDIELFHVYLTDITAQKQAQEKLLHDAYHDVLTGLPNRRSLYENLQRELLGADAGRGIVLLVNIDRFNQIVESIGHTGADSVLSTVGQRLSALCVQMNDGGGNVTVYRVEGDSFCIRARDEQVSNAGPITSRIFASFAQPIVVDGHEIFIRITCGIAPYPENGVDAVQLIKHADVALRTAKREGIARVREYSPELEVTALKRLQLEQALRHSIERNELFLVYQPQLDLGNGRIAGAEALARWKHPEMGLVSPAQFIPVAEASDFIVDIGWWVLRNACVQWQAWMRDGLKPGSIAVNVSMRHLLNAGFSKQLSSLFVEHGVPPSAIEIEITESAAMNDAEATARTLNELREIGTQVAIDDFGTGYSSFAYLKRFALHKVKIDQSFIRPIATNARDLGLVRAMTEMAHMLNLKVVAEGVEEERQLALLGQYQCDLAQGYFIARPLEAGAFHDFLGNHALHEYTRNNRSAA